MFFYTCPKCNKLKIIEKINIHTITLLQLKNKKFIPLENFNPY